MNTWEIIFFSVYPTGILLTMAVAWLHSDEHWADGLYVAAIGWPIFVPFAVAMKLIDKRRAR